MYQTDPISVYIFNLHWYAASRKLMMTWSFLSKFVFYQTSVKNCLINFLQWNARRLIFLNSSSVHLGGKSHSPITNDDFCLHNGRERKCFSHQTNVPANIIRTQSRWAQNIKPLKLVVAAYFICCILQLIHTLKAMRHFHFSLMLLISSSFFKFSLAIVRER